MIADNDPNSFRKETRKFNLESVINRLDAKVNFVRRLMNLVNGIRVDDKPSVVEKKFKVYLEELFNRYPKEKKLFDQLESLYKKRLYKKISDLYNKGGEDFIFFRNVVDLIRTLIKKHNIVYQIYTSPDKELAINERFKKERKVDLDFSKITYKIEPFGISLIVDSEYFDEIFHERKETKGFHEIGSIFEVVRDTGNIKEIEETLLHERIHNLLDTGELYKYPYKVFSPDNFMWHLGLILEFIPGKFPNLEKIVQSFRQSLERNLERLIKNPNSVIDYYHNELLSGLLEFEQKVMDFVMKGQYARLILKSRPSEERLLLIIFPEEFINIINSKKEQAFASIMNIGSFNAYMNNKILLGLKGAENIFLFLLAKMFLEPDFFIKRVSSGEFSIHKLNEEDKRLVVKMGNILSIIILGENDNETLKAKLREELTQFLLDQKGREAFSNKTSNNIEATIKAIIFLKDFYRKLHIQLPKAIKEIVRLYRTLIEIMVRLIFIAKRLGKEDEIHSLMIILRPTKFRHILTYLEQKTKYKDSEAELLHFANKLFDFYFNFDFSLSTFKAIEKHKDKLSSDDKSLISLLFKLVVHNLNFLNEASLIKMFVDDNSFNNLTEYLNVLVSLNSVLELNYEIITDFKNLIFDCFIKRDILNNFSNLKNFFPNFSDEDKRIVELVIEDYFQFRPNYEYLSNLFQFSKIFDENQKINEEAVKSLDFYKTLEELGLAHYVISGIKAINETQLDEEV